MSITAEDRLTVSRFPRERGVAEPTAARIVKVTASGVRWVPGPPTAGGSRLGGDALLPAGMDWPVVSNARPLTFLAALRLDELPAWSPLPPAGWLLFFAELRGSDSDGLIGPAPNEPGSQIRVLFVEPHAAISTVAAPAGAIALRPLCVRPDPAPTIPDDYEAVERLDLADELDEETYQELAAELRYGAQGWSMKRGAFWTLGAWSNVQQHPVDPGSVLLLEVADDERLDLNLGAGAIQFRINEEDLKGGRWHAAYGEPGYS
jgi:hypothetical protein